MRKRHQLGCVMCMLWLGNSGLSSPHPDHELPYYCQCLSAQRPPTSAAGVVGLQVGPHCTDFAVQDTCTQQLNTCSFHEIDNYWFDLSWSLQSLREDDREKRWQTFEICIVLKMVCRFVVFVCISVFRLRQPPQTLAELSESLKLLATLQGDLAKTESQIPLIHDQFAILDKYEVPVEQAVSTSLINKQICTHIKRTRYRIYTNTHIILWLFMCVCV